VLKVSLARLGYNGSAPAARVNVVFGTVRIDHVHQTPRFAVIQRGVHRVIANGTTQTISFPVAQTPIRVEINVDPSTLIPATSVDPRHLGIQVGFKFLRAKR
jgi:hypothetical protein